MLTRGYARTVVALRWLLLVGWIVATVLALQQPTVDLEKGGAGIRDLAPVDLPAVQSELRALRAFPVPLHSRTVLVQRAQPKLTDAQLQASVARSVGAVPAAERARWPDLLGGIPVTNAAPLAPGAREIGTTIVTYLLFGEHVSEYAQERQGHALRDAARADGTTSYLTGASPARVETARQLVHSLPRLELFTAAAVALLVALFFGSVVASGVVLVTVGVAYVLAQLALGYLATRTGTAVPREVEPVLVALILGVVTDYSLFFLSGMRQELRAGAEPRHAVRRAVRDNLPIVAVAAFTVMAGTGSLVLAKTDFLAAFGPALAVAVAVSLVVAATLVPALLAILGRAVFWAPLHLPGHRRRVARAREPRDHAPVPWLLDRLTRTRRRAAAASIVLAALLVALAVPASTLRMGYDVITGLPANAEPHRGQALAAKGFAPGIISPTVLLLEGSHLERKVTQLSMLQTDLAHDRGVAGVFGPATVSDVQQLLPPAVLARVEQRQQRTIDVKQAFGLVVAPNGTSARMLVILRHDPYNGQAVRDLGRLQDRLPHQLADDDLDHVHASLSGDTAIVFEILRVLRHDMVLVTLAVVLIDLLLVGLFLRALVTPVLVVGGTLLAVGASLGVTTLVFQVWNGDDGVTFYVPLATLVLLLSLGTDYGVFSIGHVWQLARRRPMRAAVLESTRRTSSTIATAGLVLAISFALLALVPLHPFLQFATAMAVGVLLDTFLIRPLLLPAAIIACGRAAVWPRTLGRA